MESGGAAMAFLLWDKKIKIFLWQKPHKYTMSLTLAKAEIVIIINYDSCFFTFDMGILIPFSLYSYFLD